MKDNLDMTVQVEAAFDLHRFLFTKENVDMIDAYDYDEFGDIKDYLKRVL